MAELLLHLNSSTGGRLQTRTLGDNNLEAVNTGK